MRRRQNKFPALILGAVLLTFGTSQALGQSDAGSDPHEDHWAVLEVGGVAAVELPDGSGHFGGSVAVEKTLIEKWLELELGISATSGHGESELAASLLFKKPWQISPKVEFMIDVGPELSHALNADGGTSPGIAAVLDFMFWPSKNVGWYLEPGYEVVFRHGANSSVNVVGGLLIGF